MRFAALLAAALLGAPSALAQGKVACDPSDKACAFAAALAHPLRRIENWAEALKRPVDQRVASASASLVEYLALDNIANGFAERPRAATLSPEFLADVRAAIDELPAPVKRALGKDFAGLYFVEDLGGTGYTDYIFEGKRAAGGFIVLDAGVLTKRRANEWATWKENTPFLPDPAFVLRARIAADANDNRRNAIQYILLHELGHVLSIGKPVHPSWAAAPKDVPQADEFEYFKLSWIIDRSRDRYVSLFDRTFSLREKVVYYQKPKLGGRDMRASYVQLEATNFATLYAATNPADDFAEAFANYVHVVLLKKPFEIALVEGGRTIKQYGPCWEEPRCAAKRRVIEALLAAP